MFGNLLYQCWRPFVDWAISFFEGCQLFGIQGFLAAPRVSMDHTHLFPVSHSVICIFLWVTQAKGCQICWFFQRTNSLFLWPLFNQPSVQLFSALIFLLLSHNCFGVWFVVVVVVLTLTPRCLIRMLERPFVFMTYRLVAITLSPRADFVLFCCFYF